MTVLDFYSVRLGLVLTGIRTNHLWHQEGTWLFSHATEQYHITRGCVWAYVTRECTTFVSSVKSVCFTTVFVLDLTSLSMLWHCWLGDRRDIRPVKSRICWWWQFLLELCTCYSFTSTFIILNSSKIQNGDILVLAYPGWLGGCRERHPA